MRISTLASAVIGIFSVNAYPEATQQYNAHLLERATNPYAPVTGSCPSTPLVRPATGINAQEASYIAARKAKADSSLASWLSSLNAGFNTPSSVPTLAATWSGGGYHALLIGAGVRQVFDKRDSNASVAGLLQAFTYESGLSGGAWFLGSVAGNEWPTISYLRDTYYYPAVENGLFFPGGVAFTVPNLLNILLNQIAAKQAAGYEVNVIDLYGRLLGYALLAPPDGGVGNLWSDRVNSANFSAHDVPFPILTARAVNGTNATCSSLNQNLVQMEMTPVEWGSWDTAIKAFTPTKYLGSSLSGGMPVNSSACTTRYDNTGFFQGTSGNIFAPVVCAFENALPYNFTGVNMTNLTSTLQNAIEKIRPDGPIFDLFGATYPNPFYKYSGTSRSFANSVDLSLVDGATSNQNNPIWPMLHRNVDVIFVADTEDSNPSPITALYQTYQQAQAAGLTRMPVIPSLAQYGNSPYPRLFGCNQPNTSTIIWLPAYSYVYPNNQMSSEMFASKQDIDGQIANGNAMGNFNGTQGWSTCVGCAILKKSNVTLPSACAACFTKYCYN